jgi:hypothetical protein
MKALGGGQTCSSDPWSTRQPYRFFCSTNFMSRSMAQGPQK